MPVEDARERGAGEDRSAVVDERLFVPSPSPPEPGEAAALKVGACPGCGHLSFPARVACPACAGATDARALATDGAVVSSTRVLHQPPDAQIQAPYAIAMAVFESSIEVIGLLVDTGPVLPDAGTAVETVWYEAYPHALTYAFSVRSNADAHRAA